MEYIKRAILANLQQGLLKLGRLIVLQATNTSTAVKNVFMSTHLFAAVPDLFMLSDFEPEKH